MLDPVLELAADLLGAGLAERPQQVVDERLGLVLLVAADVAAGPFDELGQQLLARSVHPVGPRLSACASAGSKRHPRPIGVWQVVSRGRWGA